MHENRSRAQAHSCCENMTSDNSTPQHKPSSALQCRAQPCCGSGCPYLEGLFFLEDSVVLLMLQRYWRPSGAACWKKKLLLHFQRDYWTLLQGASVPCSTGGGKQEMNASLETYLMHSSTFSLVCHHQLL